MGRIKDIADATDDELQAYLDDLGWQSNPFTHTARPDEYVLPSHEDVADVASHLQNYTGPILVHSQYSGIGKTTLLQQLLDDFADDFQTVYVGEHNVTPYELASIVADKVGVGKSSSTKLTEQKLRDHTFDEPVLLGIDEFGLNDPDTLHVIQFLNDLDAFHVVLTGMSSQWNAIAQLGSDGRAFQRRVAYQLELKPFTREQTTELVQRRLATATDTPHDQAVELDTHPFTEGALDELHDRSQGVPAVATAACAKLVSLAAYRHANDLGAEIDADLASAVEYADPAVDAEAV